jgi:hypothetical protein
MATVAETMRVLKKARSVRARLDQWARKETPLQVHISVGPAIEPTRGQIFKGTASFPRGFVLKLEDSRVLFVDPKCVDVATLTKTGKYFRVEIRNRQLGGRIDVSDEIILPSARLTQEEVKEVADQLNAWAKTGDRDRVCGWTRNV